MTRLLRDRLAPLALISVAMLWGSTFFILKDVLDRVPPTDLLGVRFLISAILLIAISPQRLQLSRREMRGALLMGVFFSTGQLTQTIGLQMTSASISGFITGLYVVVTPLIEAGLPRSRLPRPIWWGVGLAALGLGTLTLLPGSVGFGPGELLTFLSALAFAGHIVTTGHYATPENSLGLTMWQSIVLSMACLVAALPGGIQLPYTGYDWFVLFYLAVLCGVVTLFTQTWAQSRMQATRAAVIMCSEPLWAAVFAISLGGEVLGWRTALGGVSILTAMYIVVRTPTGHSEKLPQSANLVVSGNQPPAKEPARAADRTGHGDTPGSDSSPR